MQTLELKIPPPLVGLSVAALMWLVASMLPALSIPWAGSRWLAGGLLLAGLGFDFAAILLFFKARTTVNPLSPQNTSSIVRSGVYTLSRNPMYVGMLLLLSAWAVYLQSAAALFLLPLFVLYINHFQIKPEERFLLKQFGEDYDDYRQGVRRWL